MSIYEELKAKSLPLIEAYHNDLLEHDKRDIEANPNTPFLHWTRRCGTDIIFMPPADSDCYPKFEVFVPYLFGQADRGHILDGKVSLTKYHTDPMNHPKQFTTYPFDGVKLRLIDCDKAIKIMDAYARPIRNKWHNEWLIHNRPAEYRQLREAALV